MDMLEIRSETVETGDVCVPAGIFLAVPVHRSHLGPVSLQQGAREGTFEARMADRFAHGDEHARGGGGVVEYGRGGGVRVRQEGEEGLGEVFLGVAMG